MTTNGDRSARDSVLLELREADKLIVVAHENPDGDAVGSALACAMVWKGALVALWADGAPFVLGCGIRLVVVLYGVLALSGGPM